MLRIYHNPRCRKSREGLQYLKEKTDNFEVVEYLKTGLTEEMIQEVLLKANLNPLALIRTQEEIFKKELKGKNFNDEEWVKIIAENPKLLQRPIVISDVKAIIAFPKTEIDKLF